MKLVARGLTPRQILARQDICLAARRYGGHSYRHVVEPWRSGCQERG